MIFIDNGKFYNTKTSELIFYTRTLQIESCIYLTSQGILFLVENGRMVFDISQDFIKQKLFESNSINKYLRELKRIKAENNHKKLFESRKQLLKELKDIENQIENEKNIHYT